MNRSAPGTHTSRKRDRKSTRLNSSHVSESRMPSSACKKQSALVFLSVPFPSPSILPPQTPPARPLPTHLTCPTSNSPPASAARWSAPPVFFNDTATTEIYTLSLHDALPIFFSERLLLVTRFESDGVRQNPDLQQ